MEFLGLRTLGYRVPELEKAKLWYEKVLETAPYFDEPYYVGFQVAGYELGLMPYEGQEMPGAENTLVYWGVQDIQHAYDRLLDLGAEAYEAPTHVGDNIMTAAVKDPWGNIFGLIYNPHFKLG